VKLSPGFWVGTSRIVRPADATTETAVVEKPAEEEDDHHGHHHHH
jgi:hypothetical protein